jgi:hypothetical protein
VEPATKAALKQLSGGQRTTPIPATSLAVAPKGPLVDGKNRVSTVFFSLFHPLLINRVYAPLSAWVPLSGWDAYDGTDPRWMDREIKNMMSANFDIVFHAVQAEGSDPKFGAQGDNRTINQALRNFFSTYRTLIDQAYVPPQISEWVNHEGFAGGRYTEAYGQKLDLSTPAGQDYYYTMLIAHFWRQYFEIMGPYADQYLAKKHGKVMVSLDALSNEYPDIISLSNAFLFQWKMVREGVERFGDRTPDLQITVTDVSSASSPIL